MHVPESDDFKRDPPYLFFSFGLESLVGSGPPERGGKEGKKLFLLSLPKKNVHKTVSSGSDPFLGLAICDGRTRQKPEQDSAIRREAKGRRNGLGK